MVTWHVRRLGAVGRCSRAAVLSLEGPLDVADTVGLLPSLQRVAQTADVIICDVGQVTTPDLGTVDALARLRLGTHLLRCPMPLRGVGEDLHALIWLVGLTERLTSQLRNGVEVSDDP